ncbi:MAG: LysR family transcriptional regulator, partial [Deferrisomatales bacterium]|nr:LysR family transcriptional regulator [Deferrisomatales bacterium]
PHRNLHTAIWWPTRELLAQDGPRPPERAVFVNLHQLRAFYLAARNLSITRAAEELMVTPPAVSMQVKQLEESLSLRLLFRDGNSLRLTEVGRSLCVRCESIFSQVEALEDYIQEISRARSGVLRLGCPETPAKYVMPRLIQEFKKAYPGIRIVLDQGTSTDMIHSILNQRNELAITQKSRSEEKRLKVKTFGAEELLLIAASNTRTPPADRVSVTQLAAVPVILPQEGSAAREVILDYFQRFEVVPNVVLESASLEITKMAVAQNMGVSFIVRSAVRSELEDRRIKTIDVLEGLPKLEYGISYRNKNSLSPAAWAFLSLLEKMEGVIPR